MTASVTPPTPARGRPDTRAWRRGIIVGVAAAALVAGWWLFFPGAFGPTGNEIGYAPTRDAREDLIHMDSGVYPDRSVRILRITPRIVEGPDDLADQVSFHRCPSGSVGVVGAELTTFCPSASPVQGATIDADGQVVLAVPVDDTAIRIEGFVVTYRSGTRFGHQRTGSNFEFNPPR